MPRRILLFLAPVALLATALTATSVAAPSARFSVAPGDPYVGERVQFDAAATACRDAPCTYSWSDEGPDGPGGTGWALGSGPELGFTFRIAGTKYVRLTVRNAAGETSSTVRAVDGGRRNAPRDRACSVAGAVTVPEPRAEPGTHACARARRLRPDGDALDVRGTGRCCRRRRRDLPPDRELRHLDGHRQGHHRQGRQRSAPVDEVQLRLRRPRFHARRHRRCWGHGERRSGGHHGPRQHVHLAGHRRTARRPRPASCSTATRTTTSADPRRPTVSSPPARSPSGTACSRAAARTASGWPRSRSSR